MTTSFNNVNIHVCYYVCLQESHVISYLFKATRNVYIVYCDLIFVFVFVLQMKRLRSKKINQFAQNFDIVFFSKHHCEQNPGTEGNLTLWGCKSIYKVVHSLGKKIWQIWLMTEVWNPHSKANWETADAKF